MKKLLSLSLVLILCAVVSIPCYSAATISPKKVTVTKTNIMADSVMNNDGYGSITISETYKSDRYWQVETFPQAALIDRTGSFVFPYKTTWHRYYVSGDIVSLVSGAYTIHSIENEPDPIGFYTLDGKTAFSSTYTCSTRFNDGYAFATEYHYPNITSHLIDESGQVIMDFQDGFIEYWGWGAGNYITMFDSMSEATAFSDGLLLCWDFEKRENVGTVCTSIYYIDTAGNIILTVPVSDYSKAWVFNENLAGVMSKETGKIGYINKSGEIVIPCEYDTYCSVSNDGMIPVIKNGKFGYINAQNEVVIPLEYDGGYGAADGLASVGINGKYGLVDYNNNIVVPLEYDDISDFTDGVAYAIKDGYVYIITEDEESTDNRLGDADGDGEITLMDVTEIQHLISAMRTKSDDDTLLCADVDGNGVIEIIDATYIQRHLADMPIPYVIG